MLGSTKQLQAGYTIPELVVVFSVFAILSVGLLSAVTSFFVTIIRNDTITDMTVQSQNFLRTAEENLRYGAGVRQTNTIVDANYSQLEVV